MSQKKIKKGLRNTNEAAKSQLVHKVLIFTASCGVPASE